jgi:predicted O-linked N-acetylglucosamine transferase (SPINDLY family)
MSDHQNFVNQSKSPTQTNDSTSSQLDEMMMLGYSLHQKGYLAEAKKFYNEALNLQPNNFNVLQLAGALALQMKQYDKAVILLKNAVAVNPNLAAVYFNLGIALEKCNEYELAIGIYERTIALQPDFAFAYCKRGHALQSLGKLKEAIESYTKAISLGCTTTDLYLNLGNSHQALGQLTDSIISYDEAINFDKNSAEAYSNKGNVLSELKELDAAIASYNQAIRINPDFAEAYSNRGNAFQELKKFGEAIADYDQAIHLNPDFAEAYSNRGNAFQELKKFGEAIADYDQAIHLNPDFALAYFNRGRTFFFSNLFDQAHKDITHASELKPEIDYLLDYLIYTKIQLCDWENLDKLSMQFFEKTIEKHKPSIPFISLILSDNPDFQKQCAKIYVAEKYPIDNSHKVINKYPQNEKIRIGYFSAEFRDHPVSYLTSKLFELHSRDRFEVIGFSLGPPSQDNFRKRLEKSFDQFLDIQAKSDKEIAFLARNMKIDIAIDLGGLTGDCRPGIFALRAAPIQVNYLGFPGTIGADFIDYIIADKTIIPPDKQCHYTEKIAYLPSSFMVNDSSYYPSQISYARSEFNLPEDKFVFACFNAAYKITPITFAGWMRILTAVDNSVLWLSNMNDTAKRNLKRHAMKEGISCDRLIFASRMPLINDHLSRIRLADLFLDTFPYNAHTTANDALRVGLPLITLMGESFASRVAASLLNTVGLPELVTTSQEAYESLAIELATNPGRLKDIQTRLLKNLPSSLLHNTNLFTQNIEKAYQAMHQRYQDNLAPGHIII